MQEKSDMESKKVSPASKKGPKPETVTIKGDWEDAVGKALKRERPKEGWPKADKAK